MHKIPSMIWAVLASGMLLAACGKGDTKNLDDAPKFVEQTLMDHRLGKYDESRLSDGWSNGEPFDVTWNAKNVVYSEQGMSINISKTGDQYYAGELSTDGEDAAYGYGYFGTTMKPSATVGTASTFFTYTGESYGDPHDEIDIEFLGKDTTKVQFNYFANGKGEHEFLYDLGFDASKEFHQYGFYWSSTEIVWYVDLKPVYRVRDNNLPSAPQRIFHNFWKGTPSVNGWMGAFDDKDLGCTCAYQKTTYADLDGKGRELTLHQPETYDFSKAVEDDLTFKGNEEYTIKKEGKVTTVTYDGVEDNSYINVYAALDLEKVKPNNVFALDIENKGTDANSLRIDLNLPKAPEGKKHPAANTRAHILDGDDIRTDLEWGGSSFKLDAGDKVTLLVFYEGNPNQLMVMLDSAYAETTAKHKGNIQLSNFRFVLDGEKKQDEEPPVQSSEASGEVSSEAEESSGEVEVRNLTMAFESAGGYNVVNEDGKADITYTDIEDNTYANFHTNLVAAEMTGLTTIALDIENKGEAKSKIRFDVDAKMEKTIAAEGGENTYVDAEYGGAYVTVPVGVTLTAVITFTGSPNYLNVFIDSTWSETTAKHSGHIVFSNLQGW